MALQKRHRLVLYFFMSLNAQLYDAIGDAIGSESHQSRPSGAECGGREGPHLRCGTLKCAFAINPKKPREWVLAHEDSDGLITCPFFP